MAERRRFSRAHADATRAYELQPVRSRFARAGAALALTVAAAAAGAGATAWSLARDVPVRCPVSSPDALHAALADTQFKLEQERASRAALQKSADSAQAEVARLQSELVFLRSHGGNRRD
jgi:hypothetical protein